MVAFANPNEIAHEVKLFGAWPVSSQTDEPGPSIVERRDEDFLPATLAELAGEDPSLVVSDHQPSVDGDLLRLYQPVHRVFNVALVEAHCQAFGSPRLDPRKIESTGLVVRRVRRDGKGAVTYEGWCSLNGRVLGWNPLGDEQDPRHDRDPDPARRTPSRLTNDPGFDAEFRGAADHRAEVSTSLFIAPPVGEKARMSTVLYGVIPVTSTARADLPPKGVEPDLDLWAGHLSLLLRVSANERALWPATAKGQTLTRNDLTDFPVRAEPLDELAAKPPINPGATRFVLLVRQLAQEFRLLQLPEDSNVKTGGAMTAKLRELVARLDKLNVTLVDGTPRAIGTYVLAAARFYFESEPDVSDLPRPLTWPKITTTDAQEIRDLLHEIAGHVESSFGSSTSRAGRFDDPTARYAVRAFIRVKCPNGCPPRIQWSEYSHEFKIAPWFEPGPIAPAPVLLPDPFDKDFLKQATPGVTFAVPQSLAKFLNQDPKNFLKGEPGAGTDLGMKFLCGFSIPIITICAFIVLNIVLNLLNIVFHWLPFVKVCIPFPTVSPPKK